MPIPHPPKPSPNLLLHTHAPTFVRLPPPPPMLAWPRMRQAKLPSLLPDPGIHANTHLHANPPLATFFFPMPAYHGDSHLHACKFSSVARAGSASRLPFPLTSPTAPGVRRCCSGSGSLSLGRRRRPARRHLRLPPRRGRDAVSGGVHWLVPWLRKPRISPIPAPPSPFLLAACTASAGVHAHLTSRHHPPRPGEHSH
ncbi:hypothetical protein CK203_011534 [Vitis vinifera]|uniref:Uncharacterized protein n=1 Tax=Vitis vinifera TaxID=29760 RepID=A0A438JUJ5_VITVI|nr:hypothetical protein CK203_011534 [Vitis vinifera]